MMKKRKLKEEEIRNILNIVDPNRAIPKDISHAITSKIKQQFETQLRKILIYPSKITQLREEIRKQYYKSIVQAGECVGILTAQSIGERQTQLMLNSFHSAGLTIKTVVTGVPRFSELINATKKPKAVSCSVYFRKGCETIDELRKIMNHSIVHLTFRDLIRNVSTFETPKCEPWYEVFELIRETDVSDYLAGISIQLDISKLFEYGISLDYISKKIEDEYADIKCIFSPTYLGQMDIWVDTENINMEEEVLFVTRDNMINIYLEEVLLKSLEEFTVCGIPGISQVFYKEENKKWIIETEGSNLAELLAHPEVDSSKTTSNNMWEIYDILGIEAVRAFLIEEFDLVISSDSTYINKRHIKLLVDVMTYIGTISSISRYGMRVGEQTGPLGRASFEESLDNFLKAGAFGEKESTKGVSASIMCGKVSNIGTGLCELSVDISKLPAVVDLEEEEEEEYIEI